ncbi:hypothetical protein P886_1463 [Alteromonadaceae bacterium 2753L.S.0a.02]|nr:hypothetical protein P886_1463 [Alteromonadaceae bacterium 2753L.S.0a.02]
MSQGGTSRNKINGISPNNERRNQYDEANKNSQEGQALPGNAGPVPVGIGSLDNKLIVENAKELAKETGLPLKLTLPDGRVIYINGKEELENDLGASCEWVAFYLF